VFGVIAVLVVLLVVVLLLAGHGPGRHMDHGSADFHSSPAVAPAWRPW
jgi:hypothetical protein